MRAGFSDNSHGIGHLTSIGARVRTPKCPDCPEKLLQNCRMPPTLIGRLSQESAASHEVSPCPVLVPCRKSAPGCRKNNLVLRKGADKLVDECQHARDLDPYRRGAPLLKRDNAWDEAHG